MKKFSLSALALGAALALSISPVSARGFGHGGYGGHGGYHGGGYGGHNFGRGAGLALGGLALGGLAYGGYEYYNRNRCVDAYGYRVPCNYGYGYDAY